MLLLPLARHCQWSNPIVGHIASNLEADDKFNCKLDHKYNVKVAFIVKLLSTSVIN
jgi:hypothetical protein